MTSLTNAEMIQISGGKIRWGNVIGGALCGGIIGLAFGHPILGCIVGGVFSLAVELYFHFNEQV
ncbi:hypothetical protein [Staphylococcus massiliensis]|uniref:Bacteriocin n=1 Tax=Staphylococcus massiliensis S46 TaxID=1229783 RepID=K9AYU6_9STAP|nr:hypothetical protein [Staphylococcus massiliensis]EKU47727.1 hypothetical protein C273_06782 [Staphylococcus massiliensis S46]MCG3400476.1 hypothetical protein [Staphylococcus massiliensis]MCG3401492.1 hypothetical protein [Staphylococcus massiliensis]MCG3413277.1 hypothetical protein [Staphylococcus massiliensis]POA01301.1 hypothetical protein CD133_02285 [Staphylococcus massiliensis CCUG 55927]